MTPQVPPYSNSHSSFRVGTALAPLLVAAAVLLVGAGPVSAQQFELGPEVHASVSPDGGHLRTEPAVVVADSVVVVAWNDSWGGREHGLSAGVTVGWSYSTDAGRSFNFVGYLPAVDGAVHAGADSWLAYDGDRTIYLQVLSWGRQRGDPHRIDIYAVDTAAPDRLEHRGVAASAPFVDKPAMEVRGGELWLAFTARFQDIRGIYLASSEDGGRSWTEPVLVSRTLDGENESGADLTVCGSSGLVGWIATRDGAAEVRTATLDPVSGQFGPPTVVRRLGGALPVPVGYALGVGPAGYIGNNVSLVCSEESDGARFHLAFSEPIRDGSGPEGPTTDGGTGRSRISILSRNADAQSWNVLDGATPGLGPFEIFPSLTTLGSSPALLYYDWRHAEDGVGTDAYLALPLTGDGFRSVRLSSTSTRWTEVPGDREYAMVQRNFGDYISIDAEGGRIVAAWTDGRDGTPRVYVRKVEVIRSR